jgi:hypothetical protein
MMVEGLTPPQRAWLQIVGLWRRGAIDTISELLEQEGYASPKLHQKLDELCPLYGRNPEVDDVRKRPYVSDPGDPSVLLFPESFVIPAPEGSRDVTMGDATTAAELPVSTPSAKAAAELSAPTTVPSSSSSSNSPPAPVAMPLKQEPQLPAGGDPPEEESLTLRKRSHQEERH